MSDYSVFGPFAGAAFAGADRAREDTMRRKTQNALSGFSSNPDAAITNYMAVDAPAAIQFKMAYDQNRAKTQQAQTEQAAERRKQQLGALTGVTDMLRRARDTGGDVGGTYDQLDQAGILDNLGMNDPAEKAHYRAAILANPGLIDIIGQKAAEGVVVAPGAQLLDKSSGRVLGSTPAVPKPLVVRRGDGGSDVIYPTAPGAGGAPGAGAGVPSIAAPTGGGSGTSRGDRNGNPGNLKDGPFARSQPGYIGSDGTFAKFAPGAGVAAQENLLRTRYFGRGLNTVNSIVDTYLGSGNDENSVASRQNYKSYVAGRLGIDPGQPIPPNRLRDLGQAMREFETGNTGRGSAPQQSASGVAYSTPGAPPKADTPPAGYRWNGASLEPIPGGPADPATKAHSASQLKPWPQTALKSYSENKASMQNIDNALTLLDPKNNAPEAKAARNATGFGTGALGDYFTNNISDPKGADFRALIGQIGGVIIKDISGAAVSATEDARLSKWVPKVTDTPPTIVAKLKNLKREIEQRNGAMEDTFTEDQGYRPRNGGASAPGAAAPSGQPVKVRTMQQALALPTGTVFVTPDGRRKVR